MITKQYLEIKKSRNKGMEELRFIESYFKFNTAEAKRWIANHSKEYIYFLWMNFIDADN